MKNNCDLYPNKNKLQARIASKNHKWVQGHLQKKNHLMTQVVQGVSSGDKLSGSFPLFKLFLLSFILKSL
jgi:hypothetical protein